jgi:hypothetical protein
LVFSWALIAISIVGFALTGLLSSETSISKANYLSGGCAVGSSYYQIVDFKNSEKQYFTKRAIAISAIGSSTNEYRILVDYFYYSDGRDKIRVKYQIESPQNFVSPSFKILINGVEEPSSFKGEDIRSGRLNFTSGSGVIELESEKDKIGFAFSQNDKCELKINDLIHLNAANKGKSDGFVDSIKPIKNSTLILKPGFNYYGSEDWFDLTDLANKGFKVLAYNGKAKQWAKERAVGEAGRGYAIYNPTKSEIVLDSPREYRVPDDIDNNRIQKGWNLIYLNGRGLSSQRFSINNKTKEFTTSKKLSFSELTVQKAASSTIYAVSEGNFKKTDLSKLDNFEGLVWLYLFNEPTTVLKQNNLVLSLLGVGDTYTAGSEVNLGVEILNNDSLSHYLTVGSEIDSCQIGLQVLDQSGNKIYDSQPGKDCSLWPKLDELPPGAKKEYNYRWVIPKEATGKLKVRATLDYSRLGQSIINESEISVK